jgi:hypothetical protein
MNHEQADSGIPDDSVRWETALESAEEVDALWAKVKDRAEVI